MSKKNENKKIRAIHVEVDPQLGIHKLIKRIKGRSSRILREEFLFLRKRIPTLWTHSYFVASVGGAPLEVMKKYIEDQKYVWFFYSWIYFTN